MILVILLILLISGALLSFIVSRFNNNIPKYIALLVLAANLVLLLGSWKISPYPGLFHSTEGWMFDKIYEWIPMMSSYFHLSMDGISFLMLLLTYLMGFISIMLSPKTKNEGAYYFNVLLMITGVTGIFISTDLLLFFLFWELMLLPIYLLMVMFNNETSSKSSFKLLVYTQASGLILLVSILCVYFLRGNSAGWYTFDYFASVGILYGPIASLILLSGFLAAFLVKLPAFPVHGWFTSAFKDAPFIAITAGLLIKTGAYGILRFAIPMFPEASNIYSGIFMIIGVITVIYGAIMAYSQTDLRSLAAYIGVSHMGFIIVGLFAINSIAWQGVILQMIVSAISVSALLFLANSLLRNTGTCNIDQLGSLLPKAPILSGMIMFFAFAILGLPGTGNFIAEFLILTGAFKANALMAILASLGLVLSVAYSLRIIQKIVVGKKDYNIQVPDLKLIEKIVFSILIVLVLWIGIYPKSFLSRSMPAVNKIVNKNNAAAFESTKNYQSPGLNK